MRIEPVGDGGGLAPACGSSAHLCPNTRFCGRWPTLPGPHPPIILTEAGRALLDQADAIVLDVEERMLAGLPAGEVRKLASLLTACTRNLT